MLIELTVRNLAIFEDVRVPFSGGLNVVTGETGAGKSILVEAIRLLLGGKAHPGAGGPGGRGGGAPLRRQAAEAADRGAGARSRTETLDFEIGELSKAALLPGEEEELASELSLLRNAAKVREALQAAAAAPASSETAAPASMAFALAPPRGAAASDPRLTEAVERLRSAREEVQDLARELASRAGDGAGDPGG